VAALLELGMGFHPDFTGRQNVFMAGQLLGLGMDEPARAYARIEAFAEIGELHRAAGAHLLQRHADAPGIQCGPLHDGRMC